MAWTFKLCDQRSDSQLVDLTNITLAGRVSPRLNRSQGIEVTLPATEPSLQAAASDGDFALFPGSRTLKAYQDGVLRAHATVINLSYVGDTEHNQKVIVSALDPFFRLNSRAIWDATGHLADPTFAQPINAGEMIKQAIDNSVTWDDIHIVDPETSESVTPLIFPISTTGSFTTTADMGGFFTDGPQTVGDLVTALVDTGQVDVMLEPVDSSMGYPAGIMARLSVVPSWGSNRSASFQYATGTKNVESARRTIGIEGLCTRLTYELGRKIRKDAWVGNITATGPNIPVAYLHMSLQARKKFGVYHQVRVYDDDQDNDSRPLFMALWKTELLLRSSPRDLLYLKPVANTTEFPVPRPFIDYGIGDVVNVSAGPVLGTPFAAQQRVYGFDVEIDDMGIERVSELICSADAE